MGRNRRIDRPTLQDVADQAGVSIATASRALTGRGQVAPATLTRVRGVARTLGYELTEGRELVRTERLALVVAGSATLLAGEIIDGVEHVTGDAGCVVATTGGDPARELLHLRRMLDDPTISAVIVAGGRWTSDSYCAELTEVLVAYQSVGKSLVFCGRPQLAGLPTRTVDYDNEGGARAAATYLLGQGHRDILFIRGAEGFTTSDARTSGFRKACADFGVIVEPALVHVGERSRQTGYNAVRQALAADLQFTAVMGECDPIAAGAMAALQEAGRRIPEDCSVIGFDDLRLSEDFRVPLTTVHVPFHDIGHTAAGLALRPAEPDRDPRMVAGTHLVVRESTAPRKVS
ncbi:LacI family DNA-binding transcriptional regulator [Microlunatus sp. Y2014]|uniref:LacI family DNA-binding transcriptional regulator n=1 Tax=Microlunatus sp. Y2014 TaxID=3418488 RepID=UPI003DA7951B